MIGASAPDVLPFIKPQGPCHAGHSEMSLVDPLSQRRAPLKDGVERLTAQLLAARGQHEDALAAFSALAAQHAAQHWARSDLGVALFQAGKLEARPLADPRSFMYCDIGIICGALRQA